ncbi:hypothetical protein ACFQ1S_22250 [Kibdelosporangium lantanae]|uniref:Uncharacterized protein n=1 Tax=Kibdelosporangium lantanae TaxID=1497396 RepID=A0ABW3MBP3_9PSEU
MGDQLTFRILGPTSVHVGDRAIRIGGARNRVVLVLLLLHAGRVVVVRQEDIPLTVTGKVRKFLLRQQHLSKEPT